MSKPPESMSDRVAFLREMATEAQITKETLLYVRIPGNIAPLEREERFEEPLNKALNEAEVGEVAGGGSQMGDDNKVVYCGVDVYLKDRESGLHVLRQSLRQLVAPEGTVIEEFLPEWQEHLL